MQVFQIESPELLKELEAAHPQDVTRTDYEGLPSMIQVLTQRAGMWVAKLFTGNWVYCYHEDLFSGDANHPTSQGFPIFASDAEKQAIAFVKFQKALKHWATYGGRI